MQFLPDDTRTSRLVIESPPPPYPIILIYFMGPFIFGITIYFSLSQQWKIVAEGVPTSAIVTRTSRNKNGTIAHYEFKDAAGLTTIGKSKVPTKLGVTEGSTVTVLYLSNRPTKSAIYPPPLVRAKS